MKKFIGKIWNREIDYGNSNEFIFTPFNDKDTFDEFLEEHFEEGDVLEITVKKINSAALQRK